VSGGFRIGQGTDVHAFSEDPDRPLLLGGVRIPDAPGLEGHSDADVLLHAVVDALLGAAGLGDLGGLVGVDEPGVAGAASSTFVTLALERLRAAGWRPVNLDCTIVAQRPRLAPHRAAMTAATAALLGLPEDAVNVKATTTDGLGFTGRGEGIAGLAVALVERIEGSSP
jgi:2-C-methyl-D-erythritol 2,4-cyclodiphosphate synthase